MKQEQIIFIASFTVWAPAFKVHSKKFTSNTKITKLKEQKIKKIFNIR